LNMKQLKSFEQILKEDFKIVGGKAASLGKLVNSSIPVPEGFVITSNLLKKLIDEKTLNWIKNKISKSNMEDISELNKLAISIQEKILSLNIPKEIINQINIYFDKLNCSFVAVRSSASEEDGKIDAWAGQLETYLNVTKNDLINSIKKCWASFFTPRALIYRLEKNISNELSIAVIIQKMINSEKSGVAFSTHPIREDKNIILIEAGFGLGEAVVSGEITPDRYEFNKKKGNISIINSEKQIKKLVRGVNGDSTWIKITSEKFPVLKEQEIRELATMIKKIETIYKIPVDVEWAFENNNLFITQARPITTLNKNKIFNIVQKFLDLVEGNDVFQCMDTNIFPETVVWTKRNFLKATYETKTPLPFIIIMKEKKSVAYYQEQIWDDIGNEFTSLYFKKNPKAFEIINIFLSDLKRMNKIYDELSYEKIKKTSFSELQKLMPILISLMEPKFFSNTSKKICKQFLTDLSEKEINQIWAIGTNPICDSFDTRQKKLILQDIINGKNILENVEKYQYFFTGLTTVLSLSSVKRKLISEYNISKKEAEQKLSSILKLKNKEKNEFYLKYSVLNEKQKFVVDFLQKMIELRDLRKDIHNKGITLFYRIAMIHIFEPLSIDKQYLQFISYDELLQPINYFRRNKKEIQNRTKGFGVLIKNEGSTTHEKINFDSAKIILNNYIDKNLLSENIVGSVACEGHVVGKVHVITSIKEQELEFKEGEILVTGMIRPEYLPLAKKALAIITDEGGITSHAAIIARELNKPCIIGTNNATRILKTGDLVEVDANKGLVKKIK
ncbi:MAG: PEP/pyruvate-binding domain-containing protein, partial [Promethearchaeota archaeon]